MGPKNDAGHTPICPTCGATGRAFAHASHASYALHRHDCENVCAHCHFAKPAGPGRRGLCRRCFDDPSVRSTQPILARSAFDIIEEAEWFLAFDCGGVRALSNSLGVQVESLRRTLQRVGRLELYDALADREPDADHRRRTREGVRANRTQVAA